MSLRPISTSVKNRFGLVTRVLRARPVDPLETTEHPNEAFQAMWRGQMKRRIVVVVALLMCWGAGIEARLLMLQVLKHDYYLDRANNQQSTTIHPPAVRGDIVDRRGAVLAYSTDAFAIMAYPLQSGDPSATVAELCEVLTDCTPAERDAWTSRFTGVKPFYMRYARGVSADQADRVRKAKLEAITLEPATLRSYPMGELAAHVLGFVNVDNNGLAGIERVYDKQIEGQPGEMFVEWDAKHHWIQTRIEQEPTSGATFELTIDSGIQHIAERELAAGVEANKAAGGAAIVMDPRTGEILAMASYPTFDPNRFNVFSDAERRNRAIQDVYEPGSTFKMVTASAALQEGVIKTTDMVDTGNGCITIGSRKPICDASHEHWGTISFEDVIVHSSNVGAVKTGLRVGADRLSRYVRRFGFGQILSHDFAGQTPGIVWDPAKMNDSALASMSMGYQVSVTPLQIVTAASAIANGGTLYEPHVVRAIIRDGVRTPVEPKALREAVTPETAATVTSIMEDVVLRGTGKQAQLDHYQVAGKTGTAAKLVDRIYSKTDYNASFVGFAPSRNPTYAILVVVDTPRAGHTYGGDVSAPIFKRIAEAALARDGVPPTINPTPPIFSSRAMTTPASLITTAPAPVPAMLGGRPVMPDLHGLSARDAMRALNQIGVTVHLDGDGFVQSQSPAAGDPVEAGQTSVLELRRRVDAHTGGGGGR